MSAEAQVLAPIEQSPEVRAEIKRIIARHLCEEEHLFFTRHFFKARENLKFRVNWHHAFISDVIDRIIRGELKNVIFNLSPGGSKTEMVVVNLIARGLALNPWCRFLHLSYSDDL